MDVSNSEEDILMTLPSCFQNHTHLNKVFKLHKSSYWPKQAPRQCFPKLPSNLDEYGFICFYKCYCLFTCKGGMFLWIFQPMLMIQCSYVITNKAIVSCRNTYMGAFTSRIQVPSSIFLGTEVARSLKGLFLSQRKYACEISEEYRAL